MFHANTPPYNKDVILKSLLVPDGVVRIVFATVALGMGIDLRDVNTVIHYGVPQSVEEYFQQCTACKHYPLCFDGILS
jgi:ATP-dependent DNA helicase RecQ